MELFPGKQQYEAALMKWKTDHFLNSYSRIPEKPTCRKDEQPLEYAKRMAAYARIRDRWKSAPRPEDYGLSPSLFEKITITLNSVLKFGTQHVRFMGYRLMSELDEFELYLIKHGFRYNYIEKNDGSIEIDIDPDYLFVFSEQSAPFSLAIYSSDGIHVTGFYFYNDKGYKDESQRVNTIADMHDFFMQDKRIITKRIKSEKGCHNFIQDYIAPFEAARIEDNYFYITTTEEYKKLPKYRWPDIKSSWILLPVLFALYFLPALYGLFSNTGADNKAAPLYDQQITDKNIKVYICTGPMAKSYHIDPDCYGLQGCSGRIKEISLSEAINKHRKPCGSCCD